MGYANAAQWADSHISKSEYDCFEEWLQDATANSPNGLNTPELLSESTFVNYMHDYWINEVGSECRDDDMPDDDEIEPERHTEELPIPSTTKDIKIDSGFIVTPKGTQPVKVLDIPKQPDIVITESQTTAQKLPEQERRKLSIPIPRVQIKERISNVATRLRGIGTDLLGFFRRK